MAGDPAGGGGGSAGAGAVAGATGGAGSSAGGPAGNGGVGAAAGTGVGGNAGSAGNNGGIGGAAAGAAGAAGASQGGGGQGGGATPKHDAPCDQIGATSPDACGQDCQCLASAGSTGGGKWLCKPVRGSGCVEKTGVVCAYQDALVCACFGSKTRCSQPAGPGVCGAPCDKDEPGTLCQDVDGNYTQCKCSSGGDALFTWSC
jgi:hypothetical protein